MCRRALGGLGAGVSSLACCSGVQRAVRPSQGLSARPAPRKLLPDDLPSGLASVARPATVALRDHGRGLDPAHLGKLLESKTRERGPGEISFPAPQAANGLGPTGVQSPKVGKRRQTDRDKAWCWSHKSRAQSAVSRPVRHRHRCPVDPGPLRPPSAPPSGQSVIFHPAIFGYERIYHLFHGEVRNQLVLG